MGLSSSISTDHVTTSPGVIGPITSTGVSSCGENHLDVTCPRLAFLRTVILDFLLKGTPEASFSSASNPIFAENNTFGNDLNEQTADIQTHALYYESPPNLSPRPLRVFSKHRLPPLGAGTVTGGKDAHAGIAGPPEAPSVQALA